MHARAGKTERATTCEAQRAHAHARARAGTQAHTPPHAHTSPGPSGSTLANPGKAPARSGEGRKKASNPLGFEEPMWPSTSLCFCGEHGRPGPEKGFASPGAGRTKVAQH
eukprot:9057178-Alexandrium_andersonii.AAC.1